MATTTATHAIFGYTGSVGKLIPARSRREPKYSKQKQARMIHAILSRRMMSPPSYEDVLDYVDSEVTYAENKREVLAVFGERSRKGRMITDKGMRDMYCDSLHNQCVSNGLEICQTACVECKTPAMCEKASNIKKEIKKHGRKLTHFERLQAERAKEAKRKVKKAKYSTGQTVKCREGYELQCGFTGAQKITQVKRYPDYVMYAIKGKAQGFVEEDWIVEHRPTKAFFLKERFVLKEKKKSWAVPTTKPPKPTPAKVTKPPKKKKKVKTISPVKAQKKALPKKPKPSKTTLHPKTLTANQRERLRKYKFVDVSIQGKMYHITRQNVKDGKVEWYRKNGKVCLKNRR